MANPYLKHKMKRFFFFSLLLIASTSIFAQSPTGKHLIKYLEINTTESDYGVALLEEDKLVFKTPSTDKPSTRTNVESPSDLFVGTINNEGEIVDKKPLVGFQEKHEKMKSNNCLKQILTLMEIGRTSLTCHLVKVNISWGNLH